MSEPRPFFTDLDSRAAVKGSRDPLGQMSIWTRFGRHVVGNLTTVSSSLRDFTVLILGLWCVERAIEEGSTESDLALFLKFEQLAGYARIAKGDRRPFRGVERVRQRLAEGPRVTLSAERAHQILGNQKIYGLWGLYTVPGRSSGMVTGTPPRLTPLARQLVEREYVGALSKAGFPAGVRPTDEPGTGNVALLAGKGAVHPWPSERDVTIRDLLERFAAPPPSATQLGLFAVTGAREPERPAHAAAIQAPTSAAAASESPEPPSLAGGNGVSPAAPADQMYGVFLQLLDDYLTTPRRLEDISSQLGLELAQVRAWLDRAVAEDRVARLNRPLRYQRPPPRS
jgi:hypothetical protein